MSAELAQNLSIATGLAFGGQQPGVSGPDTMSADRASVDNHLRHVSTFLAGADAVIRATTRYLPKFAREVDEDYTVRHGCAKFTNVFRDLVENLASKPFARTVNLTEESRKEWPVLADFVENVDGAGNHLHVFAGDVFFHSIAYTVDWIMVDKTPVRPGASLSEEKLAGAQVYWYRVPHTSVLAVYSDIVDGQEIFTHFRFKEDANIRIGFSEKLVERVRVFDRQRVPGSTDLRPKYGPAYWQLYEKYIGEDGKVHWKVIDNGEVGLGIIPVVPVATGRREGKSWRFVKTMDDVVHLQKKLYQAETNLEYAKMMSGSPMLSGKVDPPTEMITQSVNGMQVTTEQAAPIVVGPRTVLYGEWQYIEIDSNALLFLSGDIKRIESQMREVGKQPLTTDSGNLTVVTTMFAAQKGNSAVQAWALGLKDALEQAFSITADWMNIPDAEPDVAVWTDFSIDLESEAAATYLQDAQTRHLISREHYLAEGKRRNYLSSEYDATADIKKIQYEQDTLEFLAVDVAGAKVVPGSGDDASGGNSATKKSGARKSTEETKK